MKKSRLPAAWTAAALLFALLCACAPPPAGTDTNTCTVLVEDGTGYFVRNRVQRVRPGADVTFEVELYNGCWIAGADYSGYSLEQDEISATLTLHDVRYSTVVSLSTAYETVTYHANGGQTVSGEDAVRLAPYTGHLRMNTARGGELFTREGYVLTGWNTEADGSGTHIGLGSRTEKSQREFYAEWAESSPPGDFVYTAEKGAVTITGYRGAGGECVVPETIDGLPVQKIASRAFEGADISTLVLPPELTVIEDNAFLESSVAEIFCFDNFTEISDDSFAQCEELRTIHINAAQAPAYSGTYYDTFTDKFDRLAAIAEERKLILFSGSSARFGYDSPRLHEAFPAYEVVNMGVYAYTNALPQLDMIRSYVREGDILLDAPEFDATEFQFCTTNAIDHHLFCMAESNYDLLALLDLRNYDCFFDSFGEFLNMRDSMARQDYSVSARNFDEDGNAVDYETYNEYGDFIFLRPNEKQDVMHRYVRTDYTVAAFPIEMVEALNRALGMFTERGVAVYFSYAPRNWSSLTPKSTPAARSALHEYLKEHLAVPLISEMEDHLYSGVYFYEIDNHLSDEGVDIRTERVIRDLSRVITP